ncbi:hypothetical protein ZYGR_0S01510 [Zygosaccharomyces rouxii]|uniref:ZYRO0F05852p n=2 Tax=Zygosaccharomyces rouxii TaxID=4956 RepID=C5DXK7_ZYGRC|nr:uncharacterized protein ZYRO0F05852g [Zygosaccharomyces rouxii]KAH9199279.1 centromere protein Scm3-domain-containing protein [Zygosaccharomyces rouxii]GAV50017.1 hypothetical protein ZYGR_0S01510 [Zygosaccharomyces rouxii]CAR28518.1 ZYRO0F05852p [Zygosaccharomyces rouxii]
MRVGKKPSKKAVKKLHGAIKGILKRESAQPTENRKDEETNDKRPLIPDITESVEEESTQLDKFKGHRNRASGKLKGNNTFEEKNGILYIMSKENQLIPRLTDDEVMKLHKKADENMKQVWNDIIAKYEAVENQGDVIDLQTGELIEDNGHIRGISHENSETRYASSLKGLIDVEEDGDGYSIWQDEGEEDEDNEEDDFDYKEESAESSPESESIGQQEEEATG